MDRSEARPLSLVERLSLSRKGAKKVNTMHIQYLASFLVPVEKGFYKHHKFEYISGVMYSYCYAQHMAYYAPA